MKSLRPLTIGLFMFVILFANIASSNGDKWLSYEPSIVTLRGKFTIVEKYGPPNYGENPETDEKLEVPILQLMEPIKVRGNAQSEINDQDFENIMAVQLIFLKTTIDYRSFVSRNVVVNGSLSQAVSGHHFTDVVMTVATICEDK